MALSRLYISPLLIGLLWLCIVNVAKAQISPVDARLQVQPPYSIFLSDYTSPASQRLRLSLMLLDLTKSGLEVGLRFKLEAPGVRMATAPDYHGVALYLDGGQQLILEGHELAEYFQPQNMVFQGIDAGQFIRNGTRLPEGFYRFSVEVYEFTRPGKVISRPNFTTVWISLGNPPLLSLPRCGSTIAQNVTMPTIVFSWNQFGTMPVGGGVQYYNFELFEVLPYDVNPASPAGRPEEVVRTQLPIHSEEVIGSQLIYDIGKPALFEGQQYVWRVQAFDPTGQVYYKNDGYSTVCTFTMARPEQDIATEMDFRATAISMTLAEVVWQPEDGKKYVVAHRKTGDPEYHFFTDTVQGPRHIIRSLEHSTTYEVKIAEQTEGKEFGPYSGTVSFRTFDFEAYECQGGPTSFEPPANRQPLPLLLPGDVIHVADFEMVVLQTAGQQGTFSGLGTMYVPWLGTRMAVSFQNIGINTDKQLIRGEVNFVQEVDVESLIFDLPEPAAVDAAIVLKFTVNDASQLSVSIDSDQVTIHGPNNRIVSYTVPNAAEGFTIADNKGNVYLATVQNDGKRVRVDKIGSKDQQGGEWHKDVAERLNHLDTNNQITFTNAGTFAFDAYEKWYEGTPHVNEFEILGEGYHVPWKFIPKGKSDKVYAELKGDIDPEKVVFENSTGTVFAAERKGKSFEITLAAASGILGYELYALWQDGDSTERSLGKLKVTSYPQATHTVKIVPMQEGTIDRDKIQAGLDKIYAPYGISWQVDVEKPFTDRSWDLNGQGLQSSGSGFFSQYTPEMKALNAAYGQARGFDATSVYLFYFADNEAEENNDLLGDMPLASQVGYIFSKKIDEQAIHTMAHELGHGLFHLKHPFSGGNDHLKGTTTNLMDYKGGKTLTKYQWDQIHQPKPVLFPGLQGEEEGEFEYWEYRVNEATIEEIPFKEDEKISFITPAGKIITLPAEAYDFTFNCSEQKKGTLKAFTIGKTRYVQGAYSTTGQFAGYIHENLGDLKKIAYQDVFSKSLFESSLVYVGWRTECALTMKVGMFEINEITETYYGGNKQDYINSPAEYESKFTALQEDITVESPYICPPELPELNVELYQLADQSIAKVYTNWHEKGNNLFVISHSGQTYFLVHQTTEDHYYQWDKIHGWVDAKFKKHAPYLESLGYALVMAMLSKDNLHNVLDGFGFIPIVGEVADGIHGVWYAVEGNSQDAVISFAAMIPLIGDTGKIGKHIRKGTKYISATKAGKFVVKSIKESPTLSKLVDIAHAGYVAGSVTIEALDAFMKNGIMLISKYGDNAKMFLVNLIEAQKVNSVILITNAISNMPDSLIKQFLADMASKSIAGIDDLLLLSNNIDKLTPDLVESWKAIKYSGDDNLTKLATNLDELDLVSKNLVDVTKFGGYKEWNRILRDAVKNGDELLYRLSKIDVPKPEVYKGDFYRTVDNGLDPLHTHPIPKGKSHRYSMPGEDALYFSSSKEGNIQELTHWGKEIEGNTTTYLYKSIDSENLLDLTNPLVREKFGISLDQITGDSYEFSHILGSWGKGKYNGIIAPSARGVSDNKYFVNIVIFKSGTANSLIKGKELIKIAN